MHYNIYLQQPLQTSQSTLMVSVRLRYTSPSSVAIQLANLTWSQQNRFVLSASFLLTRSHRRMRPTVNTALFTRTNCTVSEHILPLRLVIVRSYSLRPTLGSSTDTSPSFYSPLDSTPAGCEGFPDHCPHPPKLLDRASVSCYLFSARSRLSLVNSFVQST